MYHSLSRIGSSGGCTDYMLLFSLILVASEQMYTPLVVIYQCIFLPSMVKVCPPEYNLPPPPPSTKKEKRKKTELRPWAWINEVTLGLSPIRYGRKLCPYLVNYDGYVKRYRIASRDMHVGQKVDLHES